MSFSNKLTPAQTERLALLAEECGEVVQVIGKILRHGYESTHPNGGPNNKQLLEKEIADISVAIDLLTENPNGGDNDLSTESISDSRYEKYLSINKYLHFNKVEN